ncbi:hypothetical protein [Qipengyuania nanhaisediminis]|uniref:hypothetical protein n=1 Tax=Qipengyuania nanhaisediminis TaxID=604088 RepID=UPI0038B32CA6
MAIHPRTPVIVGVGQCVDHWNGEDPARAPSPRGLLGEAARRAVRDTGAQAEMLAGIDQVHVVRWFADSMPCTPPFGNCGNPPASLAADIGIIDAEHFYSHVGGDQPQKLVNEAAEAIFAGDAKAVLLAGSEAIAAMKTALRKGITLDWSDSAAGNLTDRGRGMALLSEYEIRNGLGRPTSTYPLFENALRHRWQISEREHESLMAELLAGFSEIAANNPHAQYPQARSPDFLMTESDENYRIASPYLKWHVAQDAVNQGAAIVLTSVEEAERMGIAPAKWIYLHGYAAAHDNNVCERPDLSRSPAIEGVTRLALESAGKSAAQIAHFDLYSCFPCAVFLAAEAIGLDWRTVPATVTGGLQFAGGAGNNYSMHAIAAMAEKLRADPSAFGFVLANGGYLSKEAAGVYSARPKEDWQPVSSEAVQSEIDASGVPYALSEDTTARIETLSVSYRRGTPSHAVVIAKSKKGRILARARSGDYATMTALDQPGAIGRPIAIVQEDASNVIASASPARMD